MTTEEKQCRRCGETKPVDEFHKAGYTRKDGTVGRQPICKPCNVIKSREWYQDNQEHGRAKARERAAKRRERLGPEAARRYDRNLKIRAKYGITIEDWDRMVEDQNGRCLICQRSFDDVKTCVDHCHNTGRVRGLLCDVCNQGLGYFSDSPDRLRAAAFYLERVTS